jgi:hypothetical protein
MRDLLPTSFSFSFRITPYPLGPKTPEKPAPLQAPQGRATQRCLVVAGLRVLRECRAPKGEPPADNRDRKSSYLFGGKGSIFAAFR